MVFKPWGSTHHGQAIQYQRSHHGLAHLLWPSRADIDPVHQEGEIAHQWRAHRPKQIMPRGFVYALNRGNFRDEEIAKQEDDHSNGNGDEMAPNQSQF